MRNIVVVGSFLVLLPYLVTGCAKKTPPAVVGPAGITAHQGTVPPDVLGSKGRFHGPHIMIWVNGDLYVDTALRDSEVVSAGQLANYLARIAFKDTKTVRIKTDEADPKKAQLMAKFELTLAANRRDGEPPFPAVLRISFREMRFTRSLSDPEAWALTAEGIALIEKSIPTKMEP